MDNWTFNNPTKVKLVETLSYLGVSRNLMIQSTEITYFLSIEQLESIYENLSKKQMEKFWLMREICGQMENL